MERQTRLINRRDDVFESLAAHTFPALVRPSETVAELVINQMNPQVCRVCFGTPLDRLPHCRRNSDICQLFPLQRFTEKVRKPLVLLRLDSFDLNRRMNTSVGAVEFNNGHRLLRMSLRSLPGVVLSARAKRRTFNTETLRSPRS